MKQADFPALAQGQVPQHVGTAQGSTEPKLFFDISSFLNYVLVFRNYSGIQRVVAMVLSEMATRVDADRLYVSYVSHRDGKHYCVRLDAIGAETFLVPTELRRVFFSTSINLRTLLDVRHIFRVIRDELRWLLRARPIQQLPLFALRKLGKGMASLFRRNRPATQAKPGKARITRRKLSEVVAPGDRLILLDSTWSPIFTDAFVRAHRDGMRVYSLVHDLIPLVHPATTGGDIPRVFYNWLKNALDYTDVFLANSRSTHRDLDAFQRLYPLRKPICDLPLAQTRLKMRDDVENRRADAPLGDIPSEYVLARDIIPRDTHVRSAVNTPFVLCVGTNEPRKNIWRLLMAWKMLVDQGLADIPRLVLAGRTGWQCDDLKNMLHGTGHVYGYVTLIEEPSDADLEFLYRHCVFTAMPSPYEGWGLPVGETLSYGKTAVVSNTSSLPEVGQDMVEYCDPNSIESIAAAVRRLVEDPDRRLALEARIATTPLRSWGDVTSDLLQILNAPLHDMRDDPHRPSLRDAVAET